MTGKDFARDIDAYFAKLKSTVDAMSRQEINGFLSLLEEARDSGRTIFIMGNGGSAATASHYACDFNKGLSYGKDKRFRFVCLNDNVPTLTAYANDVGYDEVFREQLRNFLSPRDLVIGVSGSGNSKNVLAAIEYANSVGAETVGLSGFDGGALKRIAKHCVHVPVDNMQITEDVQMVLDHLIYSILTK
jgi:D-sedoheptulose 7-phosphate isomerase